MQANNCGAPLFFACKQAPNYIRKLGAVGVKVVAIRYNGMIHDFGLLNALSELPVTRTVLPQASYELKLRLR